MWIDAALERDQASPVCGGGCGGAAGQPEQEVVMIGDHRAGARPRAFDLRVIVSRGCLDQPNRLPQIRQPPALGAVQQQTLDLATLARHRLRWGCPAVAQRRDRLRELTLGLGGD